MLFLALLAITELSAFAAVPGKIGHGRPRLRRVATAAIRLVTSQYGTAAPQASPSTAPTTNSALPVTQPTVLQATTPTNAIPALPSPLPATIGTRTVPVQQSKGLPPPSGVNVRPQTSVAKTSSLAPAAQAISPPGATPGAPNPGQTLPANSALASPAVDQGTPMVANLPPGPPLSAPVTLTMAPNELRIAGLGSSSSPWGIVILLTLLTLIPSLLICVTPFARLLVVFHFLRQALGLQTTPSNQTLIGLTLILTFFIMEPVGRQIYDTSMVPLQNGQITAFEALARGKEPMKKFMSHYVREKDAELFLEIAKEPRPRDIDDLSMRVLVPAYIVSELKAGFQIGAVLFLPFLVVDMVVASITTSVGMMQLPPVVISTPLKLLLFLMVDGWHLLIGALVRSFN